MILISQPIATLWEGFDQSGAERIEVEGMKNIEGRHIAYQF